MADLTEPAPAHAADSRHTLQGHLGVAGVVFLVVAAAAPLTVVAGALPVVLAIGNGAGAPMAYLIVAVVLLVFSVGYAAMSHHIVDAGAFYAYITRGLNAAMGLGAAGLALLAYTAIQAAVYGLAAVTLRDLVVSYGGPEMPWWLYAGILVAIVAVLGYRSIDIGTKVIGALIVLEIGIVVILVLGIIFKGGPEGWAATSFAPSTFFTGEPGIAIMFAVASFVGFEATAIYAEEARNPKRTVPLATYIAVIVIGVFYAIASWALVVAFGPSQVQAAALDNTAGLTFQAAEMYLGGWAAQVMPVLLLSSLFAALLAFHNAIARYLYALGRQGVAPEPLARTHPKHHSPYVGPLTQTISAVVVLAIFAVLGADPVLELFTWMAGLATVGMLALMALTGVAVIVFFRRHKVDTRVWNTRIAPVLGLIGILAITALVLANFTTLIGGSTVMATVLLLMVVAAFVAGLIVAMIKHPDATGAVPGHDTGITPQQALSDE